MPKFQKYYLGCASELAGLRGERRHCFTVLLKIRLIGGAFAKNDTFNEEQIVSDFQINSNCRI